MDIEQALRGGVVRASDWLSKGRRFEHPLRRFFTPNLAGPQLLSWCIIGTTSQSVQGQYVTTHDAGASSPPRQPGQLPWLIFETISITDNKKWHT